MGFSSKSVAGEARGTSSEDKDRAKEERRLLWKLDLVILTYSCFSYFFNYLDRASFANAYVAGLREDLQMVGNQLVVGQIPNALIIQKIAPRIWLPSMVVLWGCLTMASAGCKTYPQLCAVRFLMGLAEASTYPGCVFIIGSWYKPSELVKRTAVFTIAGQVGTMFAGVMMTAIREGMDGHAGLKGWQWVFLIDGIITLPISVMGFLYLPDTPEKTRASYLSPRERALALSRVPPKRADSNSISPLSLFKRVCATPAMYCLIFFSICASALQAFPLQGLFLLWLKNYQGNPYTQSNVNTYPLGIQGVGIIAELGTAAYLDRTGHRVRTGIAIVLVQVVCAIILIIPDAPRAAYFFAFYASGSSFAISPLLYGWANIVLSRGGDDAHRAVTLSMMAGSGLILWTFWGIAMYPATDAPYWRKGSIAMLCACAAVTGVLFVVKWLDTYSLKEAPVVNSSEAEAENPTAEQTVVMGNKARGEC
ncbi:uncharacterized protein J7T54_001950 [Emericellopsis cladophorae]|uniref:Major facilitator superfamily (MFS) profile domain-containing protein n=1 Tax=Emericellopsis cladophorae TaxID=2686198 RepID=A0A9P9XXV5_9HYPO|nr:uncharacterized protein J7T54_001950 [Emericellopsis cladophorae]KAI6779862.1 hypothetical protein J7T54_001950 [Emericellopsis cladophorae]